MSDYPWYTIHAKAGAPRAMIDIYGPIVDTAWDADEVGAKAFIDDFNALENPDIDVYFNSPGGSVFAGVAMASVIERHPSKVHAHIDGVAASIATVVALACDDVSMNASALWMIHNPWSMAVGDAAALRKQADTLDVVADTMLNVYESKSMLSRGDLQAAMDAETWYTAEQAVEAGFVDSVFEGAKVAASIPEGMFNNVPKSLGISPAQQVVGEAIMPKQAKKGTGAAEQEVIAAVVPASEEIIAVDTDALAVEASAAAVAASQSRMDGVSAVFAKYPDQKDLLVDCLTDQSCDAAQASAKLLDRLAVDAQPLGGDVEMVADQKDLFMKGAVEGMLIRAGVKEDDGTNPYRSFGFQDMARNILEQNGVSTKMMSKDALFKAALTHSTGDFANVYENVMHKALLGAFRAAPDTWSEFAASGDVSDFRAHNRYRPGSFGDLKSLNENGEIKQTTLGDAEKEQLSAEERGMIFNLTFRMLVDDDMGFFLSVARDMGRGAKRSVENDVYTHLLANGATGDGTAMFHADHGNLAASGTAISVASIGAARAAMLRQKDPANNEFLDIQPDLILVPTELGDHARTVIQSETDISKSNSKNMNPIRNIVRVVETPRLTGTQWYLFANAMQAPAIEVAFLNGVTEPSVSTEESFSSRGISYRITYDYGVGSVGYRSAYKNAGA